MIASLSLHLRFWTAHESNVPLAQNAAPFLLRVHHPSPCNYLKKMNKPRLDEPSALDRVTDTLGKHLRTGHFWHFWRFKLANSAREIKRTLLSREGRHFLNADKPSVRKAAISLG
ncbi:MAG: hypothetical protein K2W93_19760, partial [Burkholderiaceae bacterium]|nr:hypothetical protein [Burkholderiaceae bacterium]